MSSLVLTIGHSTHPLADFLALLRRHGVTALADVRSAPYSRFNPQFNRETLAKALDEQGVRYVFLGRELGARSKDPACYEDGRLQYERLARTALFRGGLDRVVQCAREDRVALMCAEKDPIDCHRTILIGRELVGRGAAVTHILEDGRLEPHDEAMQRLLERLGIAGPHLFFSPAELIEEAYAAQAARIAEVDEELVRTAQETQP